MSNHRPHRGYHQEECAACEANGKGMAWIIGIIFFGLLLFWPLMALHGSDAYLGEGVWGGSILALVVAAIIGKANPPEIRRMERGTGTLGRVNPPEADGATPEEGEDWIWK